MRSIWKNKKTFFSGILVLSIGLSIFIGFRSALVVFNRTIYRYLSETNFADAFAQVPAMPGSRVIDLLRIDGISQVLGVLEYSVSARIDSVDDLVNLRLVGLEEHGRAVNIHRYTGEPIDSDRCIWLGRYFFEYHQLYIGDTIRLSINGNYEPFIIRGCVISPEFLLIVPDGGTFADDSLSTIGFLQNSVVESIAGMPGMVNNISIVLDEGSTYDEVRPFLEDILEPYGILSLICSEDHLSSIVVAGG